MPAGTVATITVTTGLNGIFEGWAGDCAGTAGNACVLTVTRFSEAWILMSEVRPDD